jgi:hypothetical protein
MKPFIRMTAGAGMLLLWLTACTWHVPDMDRVVPPPPEEGNIEASAFTVESGQLVNKSLLELFERSLELAWEDTARDLRVAAVQELKVSQTEEMVVITFAWAQEGDVGHGFFAAVHDEEMDQYTFYDVEVARAADDGPISLGYYVGGSVSETRDAKVYMIYGYIHDTRIHRIQVDHRDGGTSIMDIDDRQRAFTATSVGQRARPERVIALSGNGDILYERTF